MLNLTGRENKDCFTTMESRSSEQDQLLSKIKEELADIERLDSHKKLFAYMKTKDLEVDIDHCRSLQEGKDRLRYECMKRNGQMKDLRVVREE